MNSDVARKLDQGLYVGLDMAVSRSVVNEEMSRL